MFNYENDPSVIRKIAYTSNRMAIIQARADGGGGVNKPKRGRKPHF
mgnify:CR=1 FL=1